MGSPDKEEVGSSVTVLFAVYVAYLVLFALSPFTPTIDISVPFTELLDKKLEGLSGILRVSAWDIWTNIVSFIPYGLLVVTLPAVSVRPRWIRILLASGSAGLLSLSIEMGQLFLPRAPSLIDTGWNTLGGITGGMLGTVCYGPVFKRLRQWWNVHNRTALAVILAGYLVGLYAAFSLPLPLSSDFTDWNSEFDLYLGNDGSMDRPWRGEIYLVALYDRALTGQEVWMNFSVGPSIRPGENRVEEGLILFYDFSERAGGVVHDRAGSGVPVHLHIHDPDRVQWLTPHGLAVRETALVVSSEPPLKLSNGRFSARSEFSVESWVAPADLSQSEVARIVSYSKSPDRRSFTFAQQKREIAFRLRPPVSGLNGPSPDLRTAKRPLGLGIQHLIVTFREGVKATYVNGIERGKVLLQAKAAFIDTVVDLIGQPFQWLLCSVLIFPLGILSYLFPMQRRPSRAARWVSFATALTVVASIEGLRLLTLKAPVEPFFLFVAVGTTLISILIAPRFTNNLQIV